MEIKAEHNVVQSDATECMAGGAPFLRHLNPSRCGSRWRLSVEGSSADARSEILFLVARLSLPVAPAAVRRRRPAP